jgi:hypothetical protein
MNANGTNTSTVVKVEPMTAPVISREAASTGSVGGVAVAPRGLGSPFAWGASARCPSARGANVAPFAAGERWRAMFSMTTTVSSMIKPMATARPPSDMRLSVSPAQCRKRKVIASVVGMASAEISVARQLRRNASRIRMLNRPPTRIASRTLNTAAWTNAAWS